MLERLVPGFTGLDQEAQLGRRALDRMTMATKTQKPPIEARQAQRSSTLHDSFFARCLIYMRPRSVGESNGHELEFDHKPALMRA